MAIGSTLVLDLYDPVGLVAIDLATGRPRAFVDTAPRPGSGSVAGPVGPVADDPGAMWLVILGGSPAGRLHKVHVPSMRIDAGVDLPAGYSCCNAVTRAGIVLTNDNRGIAVIDPYSGATLAKRTIAGGVSPKYACGRLWLRTDGAILALDPATLKTVHTIPVTHLGEVWPAGPSIWFTTADDDRLVGTIGVIDAESTERTLVATFPLYEAEGRGGKYVWSPSLDPTPGGVLADDLRSYANYFFPDPRPNDNKVTCPGEVPGG